MLCGVLYIYSYAKCFKKIAKYCLAYYIKLQEIHIDCMGVCLSFFCEKLIPTYNNKYYYAGL